MFIFIHITTDNTRHSSADERSGVTINPIYHSSPVKHKAKSECELYETAESQNVYHCPGDEIREQPSANFTYDYAVPDDKPRINVSQNAAQAQNLNQSEPVYHVLEDGK